MTSISHIGERVIQLPLTRPCVGPLGRLWEAIVAEIAPLGYEDESGFHYGVPPVTPVFISNRAGDN